MGRVIRRLGARLRQTESTDTDRSNNDEREQEAAHLRKMLANMRSNALAEWVFNFIVLIFATTSIAQPFVIPSGSMESTLMTGDHVLVDKMAYAPADSFSRRLLPYERIERGDMVVFRYPVDERQTFVKRVIGVPGDHIRMENKDVWRNGVKLQENYVQHVFPPNAYRDNFPVAIFMPGEVFAPAERMLAESVVNGELVVPPGRYFVMGDNRDNSSDSRYWGFVPAQNIVGKAGSGLVVL